MQVDGFYIDLERRDLLARKMKHRAASLKGKMRIVVKKPTFSPTRLNDIRWALFQKFRAPPMNPTSTGLPSTSSATLEVLKEQQTRAGRLARLILNWRAVTKVKSTYIDALEIDGSRSRTNWKVYGTVNGRWSSRLQSCPRWTKAVTDRVREIYAAPPGRELITSTSLKARCASLRGSRVTRTSSRPATATCTSATQRSFSLGRPRFSTETPRRRVSRSATSRRTPGFGILFSAEIDTIFQFLRSKGFMDVHLNDVQAMFDLVHRSYARYYEYCEENVRHCNKHGWMRTVLLGRIRWIGWNAKPGDVYNFPIQSFVADIMNMRLIELVPRLPKTVRIVAQIHDALILEAPKGGASDETHGLIKEQWAQPIAIPRTDRAFVMPIDLKRGERWSQF